MSAQHYVLNVPDVSCNHCKMAIENAVSGLDGVSRVEVEVTAKSVDVEFEGDRVTIDAVKDAVAGAGYAVAGAHEFGA